MTVSRQILFYSSAKGKCLLCISPPNLRWNLNTHESTDDNLKQHRFSFCGPVLHETSESFARAILQEAQLSSATRIYLLWLCTGPSWVQIQIQNRTATRRERRQETDSESGSPEEYRAMGGTESKLEENNDGHASFTEFCCLENRKERRESEATRSTRTYGSDEDRLAQRLWDAET
jgi:hypothetical protein